MTEPLQYELVHLQRVEGVVAHAIAYAGYVVVCWADGVWEAHRSVDVDAVLVAQYGGQYRAQAARDACPVRYALTETATASLKGYAFVWADGSVPVVWTDEVVESWTDLDAVVAQYAFEYTFASLDL